MSAVGKSPLDPPPTSESRKRKGSPCDTSGQSVEKRRRELEGRYIEELAELLAENMGDMASLNVKPDSRHLLRRTVDQIQLLKRREQERAASTSPDDEVQKSDISSSSQSLGEREALGPMLLEALDGFFFVVNREGRIVFVSENVTGYLGYAQEELMPSSVYSILHVGDHNEFVRNLLPKSLVNGVPWPLEQGGGRSSHTFNCRMLRRPPDQEAQTEDQEARQQYEVMQCIAVSQSRTEQEEGEDLQSCLICIACRMPRPQAPLPVSTESFITKQDPTGKIISIETSALRATGRPGWEDLVRKCIYAFFQPQGKEPSHAKKLLQEVMTHGTAISPLYRFSLSDGTALSAQTRCKFCCPPNPDVQPFIMGIHTIDREHDTASSQENTTPSLPVGQGSPTQAPSNSPTLPPASESTQGPGLTSGLHLNNGSSHSQAPPTTPTPPTPGYLTPNRMCPQQMGSPSPLGSPHTAGPTSFMSPTRPPRASPGISPTTPGLHSPAGGFSARVGLSRQLSAGDASAGGGAGGGTGSFSLPSSITQRRASTPNSFPARPPPPKPPEGGGRGGGRGGGGGGGQDSSKANPLSSSLLGNLKLSQLLDGEPGGGRAGNGAVNNTNTNNNNNNLTPATHPNANPPAAHPPPQCPASHSSLTERHKILHRLLQDSGDSTPAATKEAGAVSKMEIKKEPPASPATSSAAPPTPVSKEPQDHQLLRFLLDTDEQDLGDLPPPAALSLQTVHRVKTEKRGSVEGAPCSVAAATGGGAKPGGWTAAGGVSAAPCVSPKPSPVGEGVRRDGRRDSRDSTISSGPGSGGDLDPLSQLLPSLRPSVGATQGSAGDPPQLQSSTSQPPATGQQIQSPSPQYQLQPQIQSPSPQHQLQPQIQSPSPQIQSPSPKLQPLLKSPSPQVQSPSSQLPSPSPRIQSPSPQLQSPSPQLKSPSPQLQSPSPQLKSPSPQLQSPSPQLKLQSLTPEVTVPRTVKRETPGTPNRVLSEGGVSAVCGLQSQSPFEFCSPSTTGQNQTQNHTKDQQPGLTGIDPFQSPKSNGSPFSETGLLNPFSSSAGLAKMEVSDTQPFPPLMLSDSLSFEVGFGNPVQTPLASPQEQCVPCPLDELLFPPTTPEGRSDEKALLDQLVSFLSGTDESELAELDRALGIDKLVQGGCFEPVLQRIPSQPTATTPVSMDLKPPGYPSQFAPGPPGQYPPAELTVVSPQVPGFAAPRGAFPVGALSVGPRAGVARVQQGIINPLRMAPNQLRLQLQQRLQGPQQLQNRLAAMSQFPGAAHVAMAMRQGVQQPQMPSQPPLNAQMLAQRQRELYSFQHRQRQLLQQKVMMMRQGVAGGPANATPNAGGPLGAVRGHKAPTNQQQQFVYPPGYTPVPGSPTSPSHFLAGTSMDLKLAGRGSMGGQALLGGLQGQFGGAVNAAVQQGLFQPFGGSGMVQQDPSFPSDLSPTGLMLSPQNSTSQTPLLQQAPPPGYQSPEMKSWQQTSMAGNSLFGPSGQSAAQGFSQQGVYNNMSITVSMAGGSGGVGSLPSIGTPVGMGNNNLSNDQQVQQVQVFADVQCTVNLVGGGDSYLSQQGSMGGVATQKGQQQQGPPGSQAQQKSLLQQLLTE